MRKVIVTLFTGMILCASSVIYAQDNTNPLQTLQTPELNGTQKLACEAILCLSSSTKPAECTPSLQAYFSINHRKLSATLKAREDFLNQCPNISTAPKMGALLNALANGSGRCDVDSLNRDLSRTPTENSDRKQSRYLDPIISTQYPQYCNALYDHPYTDLSDLKPVYIGSPDRSGFWAPKENAGEARTKYDAYVKIKEAEYQRWLQSVSFGH